MIILTVIVNNSYNREMILSTVINVIGKNMSSNDDTSDDDTVMCILGERPGLKGGQSKSRWSTYEVSYT